MSSASAGGFAAADVAFGLLGILVIACLLCGLICVYCRCAYNLLKCDASKCGNWQPRGVNMMNVTTSRRPSPACHSPLPLRDAHHQDAHTSRLLLDDGDSGHSSQMQHSPRCNRSRQPSRCVELGLDPEPISFSMTPPLSPLCKFQV